MMTGWKHVGLAGLRVAVSQGVASRLLHTSRIFLVAPAGQDTARPKPPATSSSLAYVSYENTSQEQRQPPLVIQHGLFGRKENFTSLGKQIHHLTDTKRSIILPDLRNHGESPPSNFMSLQQMSADLQRLTSHLGVAKVAILGHATGGRVAMYTALTRPELVSRLIVSAASPVDTETSLLRWKRNKEAMKIMAEIYEGLSEETMARLNSNSEFKLSANTALKEVLTDSSERALFLSNLGKVNVKALLKTTMDLSTFPDMDGRTFEGPTLFISGEKEPLWRDDTEVRRIRQLFPNSHFIKLAGASYWPHTEANKEFLMQTVAFLQTKF